MPPSLTELKKRLINRGTESLDKIDIRIQKAEKEIAKKINFDSIIINDSLPKASLEAEQSVKIFLK